MDHDYLRAGAAETHKGPSPHIRSISRSAHSPSVPGSIQIQHKNKRNFRSSDISAGEVWSSIHPAAHCIAINIGFSWWKAQSVCGKAISCFFPLEGVGTGIFFYLLLPNTLHIPPLNYFVRVCDGEVKENDKSGGTVVECMNSITDTCLWEAFEPNLLTEVRNDSGVLREHITADGSAMKRVTYTRCFIIAYLCLVVHFVLCLVQ